MNNFEKFMANTKALEDIFGKNIASSINDFTAALKADNRAAAIEAVISMQAIDPIIKILKGKEAIDYLEQCRKHFENKPPSVEDFSWLVHAVARHSLTPEKVPCTDAMAQFLMEQLKLVDFDFCKDPQIGANLGELATVLSSADPKYSEECFQYIDTKSNFSSANLTRGLLCLLDRDPNFMKIRPFELFGQNLVNGYTDYLKVIYRYDLSGHPNFTDKLDSLLDSIISTFQKDMPFQTGCVIRSLYEDNDRYKSRYDSRVGKAFERAYNKLYPSAPNGRTNQWRPAHRNESAEL